MDGRSSALRTLRHGHARLLGEAAVQYLERSPAFACGMLAGYRLAERQIWESRGAWTALRNLTNEPAA